MIKSKANTDKEIEVILGNLLRIGVVVSGSVVALGAAIYLLRHGFEMPTYHMFNPAASGFSNFGDLFKGLIAFESVAIIELGILLLIATPVLRVLFSVFAFAYEKDYMYVFFTVIVLLILIFSFFS